jgi:hypothetical protein
MEIAAHSEDLKLYVAAEIEEEKRNLGEDSYESKIPT